MARAIKAMDGPAFGKEYMRGTIRSARWPRLVLLAAVIGLGCGIIVVRAVRRPRRTVIPDHPEPAEQPTASPPEQDSLPERDSQPVTTTVETPPSAPEPGEPEKPEEPERKAAKSAEESTSLRELVKDLLIKVPDGLNWVVWVVGALVLMGALIIALGPYFPAATVAVRASFAGAQLARISWGAIALGVITSAVAWILILTGLFLARWEVRAAGLALFTAGALYERHNLPTLSLVSGTAGLIAVIALVVLGVLTVVADRLGGPSQDRIGQSSPGRARAVAAAMVVIVATAYVGQAARLGRHRGVGLFALRSAAVLELVYVTLLLVIPMLLLAGADIAEIAHELCERIVRKIGSKFKDRPGESRAAVRRTVLGSAAAGLAVAALILAAYRLGWRVLVDIVVAAILIAALAALAKAPKQHAQWAKSFVPLAAAAGIFVFLLGVQVATGIQQTPPSSAILLSPPDKPFSVSRPAFSIRYPSACPRPTGKAIHGTFVYSIFTCSPPGVPTFNFIVTTIPASAVRRLSVCAAARISFGQLFHVVSLPSSQGWCTITFVKDGFRSIVWTRLEGGRYWYLMGQTNAQPVLYQLVEPVFSAMRQYWRPTTVVAPIRTSQASGAPALLDRFGTRTGFFLLSLVAAGAVLLIWRRRSASSWLVQGLLYLTAVGLWAGVLFLQRFASPGGAIAHILPRLEIGGGLALAALAALAMVAVLVVRTVATPRRPPGPDPISPVFEARLGFVVMLIGGLFLVWGAAAVYGQAARAGAVHILLSIVLIVALAWEFATAGPLLNKGGCKSLLPRRARFLAYLGYLLLTVSVVLQLGTLRSLPGGAPLEVISPETVVTLGILALGVPLLITVFLLSWLDPAPPPRKDAAASEPEQPAGAEAGISRRPAGAGA